MDYKRQCEEQLFTTDVTFIINLQNVHSKKSPVKTTGIPVRPYLKLFSA